MKVLTTSLAITLSALGLISAPARAVEMVNHGAPNVPANRIVGLWTSYATTRPCNNPAAQPSEVRNTIMFHAGGTALANSQFPLTGIPNALGISGTHYRGQDLGTWSFNPLTHQYTIKLRFDWFVNGMYHGYQTVDRTVLLSNDGRQISGPVSSTRYTADGAVLSCVRGDTLSTRV